MTVVFNWFPQTFADMSVDDIMSIDTPFEQSGRTKTEYYIDEVTGEVVSVFTGQQAANLIRDLIKSDERCDVGMQSVYYKVPGEPPLTDDLPDDW